MRLGSLRRWMGNRNWCYVRGDCSIPVLDSVPSSILESILASRPLGYYGQFTTNQVFVIKACEQTKKLVSVFLLFMYSFFSFHFIHPIPFLQVITAINNTTLSGLFIIFIAQR